jgi:hypothetical protein
VAAPEGEEGVEVADPQGLGPDVEGAAAGDDLVLGARMDPVVAQVAHTAEHHRGRGGTRALGIAGAQLAQQRDEGVAHQGVHLVEQQHQGLRAVPAPVLQQVHQSVPGRHLGTGLVTPCARLRLLSIVGRGAADGPADGGHAPRNVRARRLGDLQVGVDGATAIALVQVRHQRRQAAGLAGLARGVEQEVLPARDHVEHVLEVAAPERRQAAVLVGPARAFGVEQSRRHEGARDWPEHADPRATAIVPASTVVRRLEGSTTRVSSVHPAHLPVYFDRPHRQGSLCGSSGLAVLLRLVAHQKAQQPDGAAAVDQEVGSGARSVM